jgi:hypothetical protein
MALNQRILLLCIIPLFSHSQVFNYSTLDFNNAKSQVNDEGAFFYASTSNSLGYEIPKGGGVSSIYCGSYFFGGYDPLGQLHLSGSLFNRNNLNAGAGLHSGPIANQNAYASIQYSNLYQNSIWNVASADIDNHIANFQNSGYVIPSSIATWPGNGASSLGVANQLAPYIDVNNNGVYEPALGDYPDIRGDQAVYVIMNDKSYLPGADAMNIEVHAMFYQFSSGNYLNNTTFLNLRVFNRSNTTYSNYRQALIMDFDIGNFSDDYVGCYAQNNVLFGYNGDLVDEVNAGNIGYGTSIPSQGVVSLSHDLYSAGPYGLGGQTFPDEFGTWLMMNGQDYNSSYWIDPSNSLPTLFKWNGNPNIPADWTERALNNPKGDRRGIMTIQEPTLPAGGSICSDYAFIYDRSAGPFENAQNVIYIAAAIRNLYQNNDLFPCQSGSFSAVNQLEENDASSVFPNPSNGQFTLEMKEFTAYSIRVTDALGKTIHTEHFTGKSATITLHQIVSRGVYFVTIDSEMGTSTHKVIIE